VSCSIITHLAVIKASLAWSGQWSECVNAVFVLKVSAPALCFHNPRDVAKRYSTLKRLQGIPTNGKKSKWRIIISKPTSKIIKAK